MTHSNKKPRRRGRVHERTLRDPGEQPESPILKPARIYGGTADMYVRKIPDVVAQDFREWCTARGYSYRLAFITLIRWAYVNDINLTGAYIEADGEAVLHIRKLPLTTARNFRAYCAKRGYTQNATSATLMAWAVLNDVTLVDANHANR